mmetsp:Transcript_17410/g.27735  ORF Transcript_17410/g.27735 Transcript_17410/m.27735 type:complete len:264 (-) Transcript_17410:602-1393(-)
MTLRAYTATIQRPRGETSIQLRRYGDLNPASNVLLSWFRQSIFSSSFALSRGPNTGFPPAKPQRIWMSFPFDGQKPWIIIDTESSSAVMILVPSFLKCPHTVWRGCLSARDIPGPNLCLASVSVFSHVSWSPNGGLNVLNKIHPSRFRGIQNSSPLTVVTRVAEIVSQICMVEQLDSISLKERTSRVPPTPTLINSDATRREPSSKTRHLLPQFISQIASPPGFACFRLFTPPSSLHTPKSVEATAYIRPGISKNSAAISPYA